MFESENVAKDVTVRVEKRCKKVLESEDMITRSRRITRREIDDFRVGRRIQWLLLTHGSFLSVLAAPYFLMRHA